MTSKDERPHDTRPARNTLFKFEDVEFDAVAGELRVGGKAVALEPRPLRLLGELLNHVNEAVTREELLQTVWDGRPTVDHVVASAVSKLRAALGPAGAARLVTLPRVGYRMQGPVQRVAQLAQASPRQAGQFISGREGWVLEKPLGLTSDGSVWLARHAKLGHLRVFKFAEDALQLTALKREYTLYRLLRQELGQRDDIAVVVDAQFGSSPFFLECEYGGANLQEWAQEADRLAAMPLVERLAVFEQIAGAVAAAHSVGVLHKDLKPTNVLVAGQSGEPGEPSIWQLRLTDFGSGRLLHPERLQALKLTALGLTLDDASGGASSSGTPMYLAPELLAGQAPSMQSDVYALGLLLFQMCVGDLSRPLATGWQRDIADDLLVADIAAATEGSPKNRIGSAGELIDRLKQLQARRDAQAISRQQAAAAALTASQLERTRARRPWLLATMAVLLIGLGSSLLLLQQSRRDQQIAERQTSRANAIARFMTQDLLGAADIAGLGADGRLPFIPLLERASDTAPKRLKEQPDALAAVHAQLGRLYLLATDHRRALQEYQRGLALATPEQRKTDPEVLRMRFNVARSLALTGQIQPGAKALAEVEADAQPFLSADVDLRWSAAWARQTLTSLTRPMAEVLVVSRELVALADADPLDRYQMRFVTRGILGETLYRAGQSPEALQVFDAALANLPNTAAVGELKLARLKVNRARALMALGRLEEARDGLQAAYVDLMRVAGPREHYVNVALADLGTVHGLRGDLAAARAAFLEARGNFERHAGPTDPMVKVMDINLAAVSLQQGADREALVSLNDLRTWFAKLTGDERADVVQAIDFLRARCMTATGRSDQAIALLDSLSGRALAEANPQWRDAAAVIQAEQGLARWRSLPTAESLQSLRDAVSRLRVSGDEPWWTKRYEQVIVQADASLAQR